LLDEVVAVFVHQPVAGRDIEQQVSCGGAT
jgi:hypothetical protein